MYLIVGLGNPDKKYNNTYHNVGFNCLDAIVNSLGVAFNKGECRAVTGHYRTGKDKVIFAKPITYMNLSGNAVIELVNKYKIEQDKFIVIYDDVDLPLGKLRLRQVGSAGTHNGVKSIVSCLNTTSFMRIRVGIGQNLPIGYDLADYVLSNIDKDAADLLNKSIREVVDAVTDFINGVPFEAISLKYNSLTNNQA